MRADARRAWEYTKEHPNTKMRVCFNGEYCTELATIMELPQREIHPHDKHYAVVDLGTNRTVASFGHNEKVL